MSQPSGDVLAAQPACLRGAQGDAAMMPRGKELFLHPVAGEGRDTAAAGASRVVGLVEKELPTRQL